MIPLQRRPERPPSALAIAHPNVALVKYWGKQPGADNLPATPSLSITLDALATRTTVRRAESDSLRVNGRCQRDAKVEAFLSAMRSALEVPPVAITTTNDFPTGAGLASSASGFAALVTALDGAFGLGLNAAQRSVWARRGSASAARSLFGGFVTLQADDSWSAKPLLGADAWPLQVVVAIVSSATKAVSSTRGMECSRVASPFYDSWLRSTGTDFQEARRAVLRRDFDALGAVAERSCLKMHAVMLSTASGLMYWNGATVTVMRAVRELRRAGVPVFFTVDAGPQVKAVCLPGHGPRVAKELAAISGVERTVLSRLGSGARLQ